MEGGKNVTRQKRESGVLAHLRNFHLYLSPDLKAALKSEAAARSATMQTVIITALMSDVRVRERYMEIVNRRKVEVR